MLKLTDTIESMLDKTQMSTQMSFNTSCISTDGAAAELQHPAGFLWSIHRMLRVFNLLKLVLLTRGSKQLSLT